jgi:hypothetical protein
MSPNFPFLGDTNYRDSFKPFKVLKTPGEHGLTKVKKKKIHRSFLVHQRLINNSFKYFRTVNMLL